MRRLFLLWICFSIAGWAAESVVSVRVIPPVEGLKPGKPTVLTIELSIPRPYHINSNHPLEDYLIPTTLGFDPLPGVAFGEAMFPPAQIKKLEVSDKPMAIYEGIVRIAVNVAPARDLTAREIAIHGYVRYQACDDHVCLPPVRQAFNLVLPVEGVAQPRPAPYSPPSRIEPAQGSGESPLAKPSPPAAVSEETARIPVSVDLSDKGLLLVFLLVFLGGLALNLTPCVYPMIPITISYFGGLSQGKKGNLVLHSFLYVIGMAVTYSILGVIAAMTGSLFGAALQHPPVLIGLALVMILLALSMFDVYELRMPAFLNRLAGGSPKGFGGTFFMGLTVGIVAAPCIGPFVLGLLAYVGNKGNAVLGFALFFVLALGLGVPFLVLGIFSGSISRLPRSGAWMVWIRKIFGFILLAMAIFFLKPLFPNPLAYDLTLALEMLLAGIYLAWIDPATAPGIAFTYVRNIAGIVFFAVSLYVAFTGVQDRIESAIQTDIESRSAGQGLKATGSVQWLPYSEGALARALREAKPVFMDFYADWCAPCKELDKHTFSTPEIIALSREFIMLEIDLTSASDLRAEALRKKYQARGVPTLVFLEPDGREITSLRGTGFESKEVFLGKMRQALRMSGK